MYCSSCGAQVTESDTFCRACGNPLHPQSAAASDPNATPSTTPPAPPPPPVSDAPLSYAPYPPAPPSSAPPPYAAPQSGAYGYPGAFLDPETQRPLASWGRRVGAYLLDAVIVAIPTTILLFAVLGATFTTTNGPCADNPGATCTQLHFHSGTYLLWQLVTLAIPGLYMTLMIGSRRGQTLGMMACSIAVRDERTDAPIGIGRAFVRWLVIWALFLAFYIPGVINFLSPLWDRRRQAWHDHAARSVVVLVR